MPTSHDEANLQGFLHRLRHALELRDMTQAQLARQLGVRSATVSDWFNQNTAPSGLVMLRLPRVLGVNSGWLFSGEGDVYAENGEHWEKVGAGQS